MNEINLKQNTLLEVESLLAKGDQVRFTGGQGKIEKFSIDNNRVLVAYNAFDGPAQKWLDRGEIEVVKPLAIIPPEVPAPAPAPKVEAPEPVDKAPYQEGDVVLLANGLVVEVLGIDETIHPDNRKRYGDGAIYATRDLSNGAIGSQGAGSFIKVLPQSAGLAMKRLSLLYMSASEDNKRLGRIRREQETVLRDAVKKIEELSKPAPAGEVELSSPSMVKVVLIGADGLSIPDGWSLQEVQTVSNPVSSQVSHYAVIVQ